MQRTCGLRRELGLFYCQLSAFGAQLPSARCRTAHKVCRHTRSIIDGLRACQGAEWRLSKCGALMPEGLFPNTNMICEQNHRVNCSTEATLLSQGVTTFDCFAQTVLFVFQNRTRSTCFYCVLFVWLDFLQYFARVRVRFMVLWSRGFYLIS